MGRGQRHPPEYPAQGEPDLEELLLARPLPRPQRHRAHVLSPERLPAYRHALRPARHQLPRRRLHRRNRQLLVMSPDPSVTVVIPSDVEAVACRVYSGARSAVLRLVAFVLYDPDALAKL